MNIILVTIFVFLLNLPFGYWRANVKKYGFQWALAIHVPIPFIIAARILSDIGFEFWTYPILIAAFFMGQYCGQFLYKKRKALGYSPITSCLVMDLVRNEN